MWREVDGHDVIAVACRHVHGPALILLLLMTDQNMQQFELQSVWRFTALGLQELRAPNNADTVGVGLIHNIPSNRMQVRAWSAHVHAKHSGFVIKLADESSSFAGNAVEDPNPDTCWPVTVCKMKKYCTDGWIERIDVDEIIIDLENINRFELLSQWKTSADGKSVMLSPTHPFCTYFQDPPFKIYVVMQISVGDDRTLIQLVDLHTLDGNDHWTQSANLFFSSRILGNFLFNGWIEQHVESPEHPFKLLSRWRVTEAGRRRLHWSDDPNPPMRADTVLNFLKSAEIVRDERDRVTILRKAFEIRELFYDRRTRLLRMRISNVLLPTGAPRPPWLQEYADGTMVTVSMAVMKLCEQQRLIERVDVASMDLEDDDIEQDCPLLSTWSMTTAGAQALQIIHPNISAARWTVCGMFQPTDATIPPHIDIVNVDDYDNANDEFGRRNALKTIAIPVWDARLKNADIVREDSACANIIRSAFRLAVCNPYTVMIFL